MEVRAGLILFGILGRAVLPGWAEKRPLGAIRANYTLLHLVSDDDIRAYAPTPVVHGTSIVEPVRAAESTFPIISPSGLGAWAPGRARLGEFLGICPPPHRTPLPRGATARRARLVTGAANPIVEVGFQGLSGDWRTSRQHLQVSQSRFRGSKFKFLCENQEFLGLDQLLQGPQIRREVLHYWRTSRQLLRVSQSRFRAAKFKFLCENSEFLGLDRLLQGSQIRQEVLH
ncbi:hypothetical protein PGT21_032687 [Puccinia graminis f. sp. tritici]|uniref:Uncharacterized protein n=1 Tax=Puccinia graminis f. sp. tritici TaxID=56615 RepID=A0A5B0M7K5_PUCGR|nr:hypothetical protein PGT21_032687 [Puccinia graminis f. sp. tritici]